MIRVKFLVVHGVDSDMWLEELVQANRMPWLKYLIDNCEKYDTYQQYDNIATYEDSLEFVFHLPSAKQTYYMMKYNS